MFEMYVPASGNGNSPSATVIGAMCVTGVFAVLPLLNSFSYWTSPVPVASPTPVTEKPPVVVEVEKPIPPEEKTREELKLVEPPPPFNLQQFELSLNPSFGGAGVDTGFGGFTPDSIQEMKDIFELPEVDQKPRALVAVAPLYPYSMQESGEVIVEFIIDENGRVKSPRIHKSTHYAFEQPAIEAVRRSEWQPATIENKPVKTRVRLPVQFNR